MMGAVTLLRKLYQKEVPPEVSREVEDTARWLVCGGAQGLEELACRGLVQVGRCNSGHTPWAHVMHVHVPEGCLCRGVGRDSGTGMLVCQ
jgi:hypothetical protein